MKISVQEVAVVASNGRGRIWHQHEKGGIRIETKCLSPSPDLSGAMGIADE